ncbi:type II toxin-antitoxin system HicA family toxin [Archaeoglobus sp.]
MKLKPVKAEKVIKVLVKLGFTVVRQRGSHVILKHPDGRVTVVPVHQGEELGRGILREIIKDAGIDKIEFLELLKKV